MRKFKIFYTIEDSFPPFRVDITELFGQLLSSSFDIDWYMRSSRSGLCTKESFNMQVVYLPFFTDIGGFVGRLINKLAFWFFDIWWIASYLFRPVDLIQVRDKYIAALFGLLIARIKGVPFVYWCSFPFPEHFLERVKYSKGLKRIYSYLHGSMGEMVLYFLVMRSANHVFVQSLQMQHDIASYGVPKKQMTVVPMGVPQKLLKWAEANAMTVQEGRIVYLGTMATVRQLHVLIEAFALVNEKFPKASLLMIGDGDFPHERLALETKVANLNLNHVVTFTGFLPIDEAWSLSATAAICVSPFYPTKVLASTSPTKLVEYMALGRPVVCNDHPEQSVVIRESGAGLCVPWGAVPFANAMIWMLEHPDEAEKMGTKGPSWVKANRAYSVIASNVMQKYHEILGVN